MPGSQPQCNWHHTFFLRLTAWFNLIWNTNFRRNLAQLCRFDSQFDSSSHLIFNRRISEFRHKAYLDAIETEVAGCQDERVHSLIDRSRTDRLYIY